MKNIFAACFLSLGIFISAQEKNQKKDSITAEKTIALEAVTVMPSMAKMPVKSGKSPIKPIDLPQSFTVVDNQTIKQQQVLRLSDVLKNANGVYISGASNASGNNQEEMGSRGFAFSGNNTFKNGVRFNSSLIPETSSLESVEILKGSAALLFGNVAPGGILNLVTKKPKFENGGEFSVRISENQFYKPTIDIYGAVNNSKVLAYRMISSFEKGNSFRDVVASERFFINPSFLLKISPKTTLVIEGDYTKDNRTPDFGLTTINYDIVALPRNAFLGFDWGKFESVQQSATTVLTHRINENWYFKSLFSYQGYATALFASLRPNTVLSKPIFSSLVQPNGDWFRGVQKTNAKQDYRLLEFDLNGSFKTGKLKHTFLIGIDADASKTGTLAYKNIEFFDKINIYNPYQVLEKNSIYNNSEIPILDKNTNTVSNVKRAGIYMQDLISVYEKIKILAGLRYSYIQNESNTLTYATGNKPSTTTNDRVFSPKIGLVYQPTTKNAVFLSFSDSFVPNTGTDRFFNPLPVSRLNQYELGFKNQWFDDALQTNLTGYIIDYSNLAQTDFSNGNVNTNIKELTGAYASKGVELDINGTFKKFKLIAGYSFNETRYTKSNIFTIGTPLRFVPKHTANASLFYDLHLKNKASKLEIGVQTNYTGKRFGGRLKPLNASTDAEKARKLIPVEGFFQLDLNLNYNYKSMSIRTKLANIANVVSYYAYDDNTITPIAPRMITTTLSYKF
jgi:iron complex outermembrane recepter protein